MVLILIFNSFYNSSIFILFIKYMLFYLKYKYEPKYSSFNFTNKTKIYFGYTKERKLIIVKIANMKNIIFLIHLVNKSLQFFFPSLRKYQIGNIKYYNIASNLYIHSYVE